MCDTISSLYSTAISNTIRQYAGRKLHLMTDVQRSAISVQCMSVSFSCNRLQSVIRTTL